MMTYWAKKLDILSLNTKGLYKVNSREKIVSKKVQNFLWSHKYELKTWVGRISKGRNAVPLKNIANRKYPDSNYFLILILFNCTPNVEVHDDCWPHWPT